MADAVENEKREDEPKGPVDLNGEYRFKVDGKGRVSLPSKFRKVLSKDLVVARELEDQCLYVFETPDYNAWVEKLFVDKFGEYKESDRMHVALHRKLKGRARDVEVDASGRIMLTGGTARSRRHRQGRRRWWATRAVSRSGTRSATSRSMPTPTWGCSTASRKT